jgi:hypothetical protein
MATSSTPPHPVHDRHQQQWCCASVGLVSLQRCSCRTTAAPYCPYYSCALLPLLQLRPTAPTTAAPYCPFYSCVV